MKQIKVDRQPQAYILQIRKEPKEASKERAALQAEANAARKQAQVEKNEAKTKMKGKNKPSRRFRKKKSNVIEEKKVHMHFKFVLHLPTFEIDQLSTLFL